MKVYLPVNSKQGIGGGWTFQANLKKGLEKIGHSTTENVSDADIALIAGTSMVNWDTVNEIKNKGLKMVVRLDNVPRNSRNRNTGTSRLKGFCDMADEVVWQCHWAKEYLIDFIGKEGRIIYNGVDTEIFKPEGDSLNLGGDKDNIYLYSRFNRDETKNWEVAWYKYQLIQRENKHARLVIVGKFSDEQINYNFDFFRGEHFDYFGVITNPEDMARIYRSCKYLLATYYNDCYSNTYNEALSCGLELYEPDMSGGTYELIRNGPIPLDKMAKEYEKLFQELLEKA